MGNVLSSPTKVVLTGGTDGIGRVLRDRLLGAGHEVVVIARRAAAMKPIPRLHGMACDLSDPHAVRLVAAEIRRAHPDIRVLINNAALQYDRPLIDPELDLDRLEDEVAINLLAPALLIHGLLPALLAHRRAALIVNVNSGLAIFPKQRTALYCASKAGLHSLSQSLRGQLEGTGVAVAEAFLPLVDTAMTKGRGSGKLSAEDAADAILSGVMAGRRQIWVGKAALVPLFARFAPGIGRAALRGPR
jgi:uncharacterized oxidoreductase